MVKFSLICGLRRSKRQKKPCRVVRTFGSLGGAEALIDGAGGSHGRLVDAPVEEEHDEHGYVEGAESRVHHVAGLVSQLAFPRARRVRDWCRTRLSRVLAPAPAQTTPAAASTAFPLRVLHLRTEHTRKRQRNSNILRTGTETGTGRGSRTATISSLRSRLKSCPTSVSPLTNCLSFLS